MKKTTENANLSTGWLAGKDFQQHLITQVQQEEVKGGFIVIDDFSGA